MYGVSDPQVETAVGTYVKLLRATRAVLGRVERRLTAHGLTPTQLGVLEAILHKGPQTHRDLGRRVLTSAANMTDVIDKLTARGLVVRCRSPDDKRQVRVDLTGCGRELIQELFPRHAGDIALAMGGLDADQLVALGNLLRDLGMAASSGTAAVDVANACTEDHLAT